MLFKVLKLFLICCTLWSNFNQSYALDRVKILNEVEGILKNRCVGEISNEKVTYGLLRGLISEIDEYSDFFTPVDYKNFLLNSSGESGGIGVEVARHEEGIKIISVVQDSPAGIAGLQSKDILTHINGHETRNISLFRAGELIQGENGTSIELIVKNQYNQTRILWVKRAKINLESVKILKYSKIPVVKIKFFNQKTYQEMLNALKQVSKSSPIGLIIDLQDNPGGLLEASVDLTSFFLPRNSKIISITKKDMILKNIFVDKDSFDYFHHLPIVIITNDASASGAEVFASALSDNKRAKIVGTKTYGKGVVQDVIPLKLLPHCAIKITVATYRTIQGREINKNGLIPDVFCKNCVETAENMIKSYY